MENGSEQLPGCDREGSSADEDGEWNLEGAKELFEAAHARAVQADPKEAPFPLIDGEARIWHEAQASVLQWVLEMLPSAQRENVAPTEASDFAPRLTETPSTGDALPVTQTIAHEGAVDFVYPGYLAALSDAFHYLKGGERDFQARKLDALHTLLASTPLFTHADEDAYTSEMGAAANLYHATFSRAHPLPAQWRWSEVWRVMKAAESIVKATQTHVLYEKGDLDAPDCIKDRNGDIVLGLCKVCGKGEAELAEPCTPQSKRDPDEVRARLAGWADFEDSEDPKLLVVAHDDRPVHFTGPKAWTECLEWDARNGYANIAKESTAQTPSL